MSSFGGPFAHVVPSTEDEYLAYVILLLQAELLNVHVKILAAAFTSFEKV